VGSRLFRVVFPIIVLSWHPPFVVVYGGLLVMGVELIGVGDVPTGIGPQ
jgi:hypothetical protein